MTVNRKGQWWSDDAQIDNALAFYNDPEYAHAILTNNGYKLVDADFVCDGEPRPREPVPWTHDVRAVQARRAERKLERERARRR